MDGIAKQQHSLPSKNMPAMTDTKPTAMKGIKMPVMPHTSKNPAKTITSQ